jgi:23S rRNA G2445 N2-methylase RlmL
MARPRTAKPLPPCYAATHPGLEAVAADEIASDLGGEVRRTGRGLVVFRVEEIGPPLLSLRTAEDVFLLAWGTDKLSYRAEDLDKIERWTAREADWEHLLHLHQSVRPRPKGRPTYRLVVQMRGEHGYQRRDALKALARGLVGKVPDSWRAVEENAGVEFWLSIQGAQAACGLRLSDRSLRHRTYKVEHRPASLRPTLAAAMVRLAGSGPHAHVLDPMCGAGTLLAEHLAWAERFRGADRAVWGGDIEQGAVRAASANLRKLGRALLARWDATRLPLAGDAADRILCNPPFGKKLGEPEDIGPLYRRLLPEFARVLKPGGRAVLLAGDQDALTAAARTAGLRSERLLPVRLLGQRAVVSVWRKDA